MSVADYLSVNISCKPAFIEIMVAELSMLNYDSMMEKQDGLEAYIKPEWYDEQEIKMLQAKYPEADMEYGVEEVIERNWNEEWEQNYEPIVVEDKILVRATFHEANPDFDYEIEINPRMSFGTGHHATTYLMLKNQLAIDHKSKSVLDAGCGTAILAVMAEKLGASRVVAYDNNTWSTENAPENIALNACKNIEVREGTIETINLDEQFDIILANINKNVLLEEMNAYVKYLVKGGHLLLSGFYETDENELKAKAKQNGLTFESKTTKSGWCSLLFTKN